MSASFTVCTHCKSCFLLQHVLSFLTAVALLQIYPPLLISFTLECCWTYFISCSWEPTPSLTLGSFLLSSLLASLSVSLPFKPPWVLEPFQGLHNHRINIVIWPWQRSRNFPSETLKSKVGIKKLLFFFLFFVRLFICLFGLGLEIIFADLTDSHMERVTLSHLYFSLLYFSLGLSST